MQRIDDDEPHVPVGGQTADLVGEVADLDALGQAITIGEAPIPAVRLASRIQSSSPIRPVPMSSNRTWASLLSNRWATGPTGLANARYAAGMPSRNAADLTKQRASVLADAGLSADHGQGPAPRPPVIQSSS